MANPPYPVSGETIVDLRRQIGELIRDLYEERIGGAALGDVFAIVGDILTLVLATTSGLTKSGAELAVEVTSTGGLQLSTSGISIKLVSTGGLQSSASGLSVKLNGDSLAQTADGLSVSASIIDVGNLDPNNLLVTDAASVITTFAPDAGWSVSNADNVRALDANTAGCTQLADILGTLITVLISKKVLSA